MAFGLLRPQGAPIPATTPVPVQAHHPLGGARTVVVANRGTWPDAAYHTLPHFFDYVVRLHGAGIDMTDVLDGPAMLEHVMFAVPGVVAMGTEYATIQ